MRDAISWFSLLLWGSRILGVPLYSLYWLLKFFRRRAAAATILEAKANLWPCLHDFWWTLHKTCLENKGAPRFFRKIDNEILHCELYTDSCLDGWGVVLFVNGRIFWRSGSWMYDEKIAILECRALTYGLRFAESVFQELSIPRVFLDIFVDNTSVISAAERGFSAVFILNQCVATLKQIFGSSVCIVGHRIRYVPSKFNYADRPSRNLPPQTADVTS